MTGKTSDGEAKTEVETKKQPRVDPTNLDSEAKNREEKQLAQVMRSFEAGDYKDVRRSAKELMNSSDPRIVEAAKDLKRRVDVDPVQTAVIIFCSAVFLAIVITYVLR